MSDSIFGMCEKSETKRSAFFIMLFIAIFVTWCLYSYTFVPVWSSHNVKTVVSNSLGLNWFGKHWNRAEISNSTPIGSTDNNKTVVEKLLKKPRKDIKTVVFLKGFRNNGLATTSLARELELESSSWCRYRCRVRTSNTLSTGNADLAVFFSEGVGGHPPITRKPHQSWLFMAGESQRTLSSKNPTIWDGLFNYSVTFTRASHLYTHECGHMFSPSKLIKNKSTRRNFAAEKRAMLGSTANVLWMVSNCSPGGPYKVQSGRMEYTKELSKFINIDAFTRKSNCRSQLGNLLRKKTAGEPKYKNFWFYLAFENSLCKDYITEKYWKVIHDEKSLVIPVVMGGLSMDDYERKAPPNSYIHVRNFTSPKHLADHLKYVAENDDAFNYYHEWRNQYTKDSVDLQYVKRVLPATQILNLILSNMSILGVRKVLELSCLP